MDCSYLNVQLNSRIPAVKHIPNMKKFCSMIVPYVYFNKKKDDYYYKTVYNILTGKILLILSNFQKCKGVGRGIVESLVTSLIGFAYWGISHYLYSKRQKALQKTFQSNEKEFWLGRNKKFHL